VKFTDLTKVLLQGRRFVRPLDLETRGLWRVLHSFAGAFTGAITVAGFAIAVGTYLYKDFIEERAKNIVSTLNSAESHYQTIRKLDEISERTAEINARLQPQRFSEEMLPFANYPDTILNWKKRINDLYSALPKEDAQEVDNELRPTESEIELALRQMVEISRSPTLSQEEKRAKTIPLYQNVISSFVKLEVKVIDCINKEKQKEQNHLAIVSALSPYLYIFGLVIGVLGQLAGINPKKHNVRAPTK
jgi:hypothetical protein